MRDMTTSFVKVLNAFITISKRLSMQDSSPSLLEFNAITFFHVVECLKSTRPQQWWWWPGDYIGEVDAAAVVGLCRKRNCNFQDYLSRMEMMVQ